MSGGCDESGLCATYSTNYDYDNGQSGIVFLKKALASNNYFTLNGKKGALKIDINNSLYIGEEEEILDRKLSYLESSNDEPDDLSDLKEMIQKINMGDLQ